MTRSFSLLATASCLLFVDALSIACKCGDDGENAEFGGTADSTGNTDSATVTDSTTMTTATASATQGSMSAEGSSSSSADDSSSGSAESSSSASAEGTSTGGSGESSSGGGSSTTTTGGVAFEPAPGYYWSFDDSTVAGATIAAVLGGIDGTYEGDAASAAGYIAESAALDGQLDYVEFGDVLDQELFAGPDRQFSVAMWFRVPEPVFGDGMGNTSRLLWAKAAAPAAACGQEIQERETFLGVLDNGRIYGGFYFALANVYYRFVITETVLAPNTWYHVVMTYDGTVDTSGADRLAIYIDGVIEKETEGVSPNGVWPGDIQDGPAPMVLGDSVSSQGPCASNQLEGDLDELALWDQVLSAEDATALYQWGLGGLPIAE